MKLVGVEPSWRKDKKLVATFDDGTVTHFGARGYNDYVSYSEIGHNLADERRRRYVVRHRGREDWSDPRRAGTLSRYVLWEKRTVPAAVRAFKRRFGV